MSEFVLSLLLVLGTNISKCLCISDPISSKNYWKSNVERLRSFFQRQGCHVVRPLGTNWNMLLVHTVNDKLEICYDPVTRLRRTRTRLRTWARVRVHPSRLGIEIFRLRTHTKRWVFLPLIPSGLPRFSVRIIRSVKLFFRHSAINPFISRLPRFILFEFGKINFISFAKIFSFTDGSRAVVTIS